MITDKNVQRLIKAAGYYGGPVDGDFGPKSWEAVEKLLVKHKPEALDWIETRKKVAVVQIVLYAAGFEPGEIDGYYGHNTQNAFETWADGQEGRPSWSSDRDYKDTKWPSQSGVRQFFGEPGSSKCTAGKVQLPIPFKIAWNTSQSIRRFSCHELVADALTGIYADAVQHYGENQFRKLRLDLFGGCYNLRKMRGGSRYSMHSWGIAVDHDPERNQLRWDRNRASFARPEYDAWWRIVEGYGAISLGRQRDFDWMHFQFATL